MCNVEKCYICCNCWLAIIVIAAVILIGLAIFIGVHFYYKSKITQIVKNAEDKYQQHQTAQQDAKTLENQDQSKSINVNVNATIKID